MLKVKVRAELAEVMQPIWWCDSDWPNYYWRNILFSCYLVKYKGICHFVSNLLTLGISFCLLFKESPFKGSSFYWNWSTQFNRDNNCVSKRSYIGNLYESASLSPFYETRLFPFYYNQLFTCQLYAMYLLRKLHLIHNKMFSEANVISKHTDEKLSFRGIVACPINCISSLILCSLFFFPDIFSFSKICFCIFSYCLFGWIY